MENYKIEGNIDFYAELYKSLDDEENILLSSTDDNKCLITGDPLIDKYVTMVCGHKFNYEPLYKDILNHKQKFNAMESSTGALNHNQIRCPYCRNAQYVMLPYYEDIGFKKLNGVNYYDPNIKPSTNCAYSAPVQMCQYQIPNPNYDEAKPSSQSNSKMIVCSKYYAQPIVIYNYDNQSEPITYNDTKCYCYIHKKLMIKKYKQEEKDEKKQQAKAVKEQAKIEAKAVKEQTKIEAKAAKEQTKQLNVKTKNTKKLYQLKPTENVIIGNVTIGLTPENNGCVQILKSGPNKGNQCGCKIILGKKCKRHALPLL